MFNGIAAARGVSIGPALLLRRSQISVREQALKKNQIRDEITRFQEAIEAARTEIEQLRLRVPSEAPPEVRTFFDTHLLMLEDEALVEPTIQLIRERACNAEWALKLHREELMSVFEAMDDPYLRSRKNDVSHVIDNILKNLLGEEAQDKRLPSGSARGAVIIAEDLTPVDTVELQNDGVAGFIIETGGPLSHAAILARSLGIPAITGVHGILKFIQDGDQICLDGGQGLALVDADDYALQHLRRKQRAQKRFRRNLEKLRDAPTATACGTPITLRANIELEEDVRTLRKLNVDGVGLYRTEFLYLHRHTAPDEEEHYRNYVRVIRALKGAPLTIRTVDLGADKEMKNHRAVTSNPALGLRGIRRCLVNHSMFLNQLRAILRAAAKGPVNIMFPMITSMGEIRQCEQLLEQARESLRRGGFRYGNEVRLGAMIEVPAAAIRADQFAAQLDFLSIGTNDLIQYTLAIDRDDEQVSALYDPLHPAVLTLIQKTINAGTKSQCSVAMCGEMAGDPRYIRLLLGLGLREFSVPLNAMLEVKDIFTRTELKKAKRAADAILKADDREQQLTLLQTLNKDLDLS